MRFLRAGSRSLCLGVSSHVQQREARLLPLLAPGCGPRALWKRRHLLRSDPGWHAGARWGIPRVCPAAFDPADAEPATITNLNAAVGLAYVSGMVTQTNIKTGEVARLPFVDSDMRFMQGVFRARTGKFTKALLPLFESMSFARSGQSDS